MVGHLERDLVDAVDLVVRELDNLRLDNKRVVSVLGPAISYLRALGGESVPC